MSEEAEVAKRLMTAAAAVRELGGVFMTLPEPRDRREARARRTARRELNTFASYFCCVEQQEEDMRVVEHDPFRPLTAEEREGLLGSYSQFGWERSDADQEPFDDDFAVEPEVMN